MKKIILILCIASVGAVAGPKGQVSKKHEDRVFEMKTIKAGREAIRRHALNTQDLLKAAQEDYAFTKSWREEQETYAKTEFERKKSQLINLREKFLQKQENEENANTKIAITESLKKNQEAIDKLGREEQEIFETIHIQDVFMKNQKTLFEKICQRSLKIFETILHLPEDNRDTEQGALFRGTFLLFLDKLILFENFKDGLLKTLVGYIETMERESIIYPEELAHDDAIFTQEADFMQNFMDTFLRDNLIIDEEDPIEDVIPQNHKKKKGKHEKKLALEPMETLNVLQHQDLTLEKQHHKEDDGDNKGMLSSDNGDDHTILQKEEMVTIFSNLTLEDKIDEDTVFQKFCEDKKLVKCCLKTKQENFYLYQDFDSMADDLENLFDADTKSHHDTILTIFKKMLATTVHQRGSHITLKIGDQKITVVQKHGKDHKGPLEKGKANSYRSGILNFLKKGHFGITEDDLRQAFKREQHALETPEQPFKEVHNKSHQKYLEKISFTSKREEE